MLQRIHFLVCSFRTVLFGFVTLTDKTIGCQMYIRTELIDSCYAMRKISTANLTLLSFLSSVCY